MHIKTKITSIALFALIPQLCFATVGGAERIEVLGYDSKDQKIFLTRHYEDASGRLPTLYYYQLNTRHPTQLIEVKSIYKKIDQRSQVQVEKDFYRELNKIQSRLVDLKALKVTKNNLNIIDTKIEKGDFWYTSHPDDAFVVHRYTQQYRIKNGNFQSNIAQSIAYIKPNLKVKMLYSLPQSKNQNLVQLAIVQYNGIPVETGYQKEDPILLMTQKKR